MKDEELDKEKILETAERIKLLGPFILDLDLEILRHSRDALVKIGDKDDAIGCLLKPEGYEERSDIRKAQLHYLDALIDVRVAMEELKDAQVAAANNQGEREKVLKALGLF